MRIQAFILSTLFVAFGYSNLQAGGKCCGDKAEAKTKTPTTEIEGTITSTKNDDGTFSISIKSGDKTIAIKGNADDCKRLADQDGKTVKISGKLCKNDKGEEVFCISDCDDVKTAENCPAPSN